uniref:ATP synthase subunit g, mitochondrial n=1 Tax=Felis catus TaxID=9685 RepID=A0ABI8A946_FELCA
MAQFVRNLAEKAPALVNAAVTYSKPRLATFWHYAKVELVPPTPAEIPTAIQSLKKIVKSAQTGSFKQLTVKTVSVATWFPHLSISATAKTWCRLTEATRLRRLETKMSLSSLSTAKRNEVQPFA